MRFLFESCDVYEIYQNFLPKEGDCGCEPSIENVCTREIAKCDTPFFRY